MSIKQKYTGVYKYNSTPEKRDLTNFNQAVQDTSQLVIPGLEAVNYFIQSFTMPSVNIPGVDTPFKGEYTSLPGDHVIYGEVTVDILVDEDLRNWEVLVEWMKDQCFLDDVYNRMVDIDILWKNRNGKHIKTITLNKAYITDLSGFSIVSNNQDQDTIISTATFKYQYFRIKTENNPKAVEV